MKIDKNEYEELIRDSVRLEMITNEVLCNPYCSRDDVIRMLGYQNTEKTSNLNIEITTEESPVESHI